jgi:hypothetical protein
MNGILSFEDAFRPEPRKINAVPGWRTGGVIERRHEPGDWTDG